MSWFESTWIWIKQYPVTFSIAGAMTLLAVVGVIVAIVTKGRWTDRGLIKNKKDGETIQWENRFFPLAVSFDRSCSQELIDLYRSCQSLYNSYVGRTLFDYGQPWVINSGFNDPPGNVLLKQTADVAGGKTSLTLADDNILSATISINPRYANNKQVLLHELGHTLGLDHDEHISSIMYPKIQYRPQELSENDRLLLKRTYGKNRKGT